MRLYRMYCTAWAAARHREGRRKVPVVMVYSKARHNMTGHQMEVPTEEVCAPSRHREKGRRLME